MVRHRERGSGAGACEDKVEWVPGDYNWMLKSPRTTSAVPSSGKQQGRKASISSNKSPRGPGGQ